MDIEDDLVLPRIARHAIEDLTLPAEPPQSVFGGPGYGGACALCDAPIDASALEMEIVYGASGAVDTEAYHLHLRCYTAWDAERARLAVQPQASPRAINGRALPNAYRGGKIDANDTPDNQEGSA